MLLCTKIRLRGSPADAEALAFLQRTCRRRDTWWPLPLRDGEQWPGWVETKATLEASKEHDPEWRFVYGTLVQAVDFRLDRAMAAFFRRVQAGVDESPGFPRVRVRPRPAFFPLCYPAMYIKGEGTRGYLPTGGGGHTGVPKRYPTRVAQLTEPAPTTDREGAISRDARGATYASLVTEEADAAERPRGMLASDLGIKTVAPSVNEHGRVYSLGGVKGSRWYTRQLDKIRSKRDRCQKKSRRYIHLSQVYQRVSERKRHKQRDGLHTASHLIAHRLVASTVGGDRRALPAADGYQRPPGEDSLPQPCGLQRRGPLRLGAEAGLHVSACGARMAS